MKSSDESSSDWMERSHRKRAGSYEDAFEEKLQQVQTQGFPKKMKQAIPSNGISLRKERRAVQFSKTANGKVRREEIPAPRDLEDVAIESLWWTPSEIAQIKSDSLQALRTMRQESMDTIRHYLCVYSQCHMTPTPHTYLDTVQLKLGDARGLEHGMASTVLRAERKSHAQTVLQWQERLRVLYPTTTGSPDLSLPHPSTPDHLKAAFVLQEELANHATRSSHPCSVMARLLAREDALQISYSQ